MFWKYKEFTVHFDDGSITVCVMRIKRADKAFQDLKDIMIKAVTNN